MSLPFFWWEPAALFLTALSPLLSACGALAGRHWSWVILMGLPLLILSAFRGRWFCVHLCPMGLALETAGRMNPRARSRFTRLPHASRFLTLFLLGSALVGYPLVIWLDPLSIFSGFFSAWRLPIRAVNIAPAAGFLLLTLLSVLIPQAWCHRLCPLGATQDLLSLLGKRWRTPVHPVAPETPPHRTMGRRVFLGALMGGTGALAARHYSPLPRSAPVRPPGAAGEDVLGGLCARCGNCMATCPTQIIRPDLGSGGLSRLMTPVLKFDGRYCDEWCNACTKVCPTGALRPLTVNEKRKRPLGHAKITQHRCIAWTYASHCMVCQEFCPYQAIEIVEHNGVNCPVVMEAQCRGCGACESACPALPKKAIVVQGLGA